MLRHEALAPLLLSLLMAQPASSESFKILTKRDHALGEISVLTGVDSLRLRISGSPPPACTSEIVANPPRAVINCVGLKVKDKSSIVLPKNIIAKRIRFGHSATSLKIVADLNIPTIHTETLKEQTATIYSLSATVPTVGPTVELPPSLSDAETSEQASEAPARPTATPLIDTSARTGEKPPVLMTAVPAPVLSHGETLLASFAFTKQGAPPAPVLKFVFWEKRPFELSRTGSTKYVLTFKATKVSTPIFLSTSTAPDGYAPFSKVTITQSLPAGSAASLAAEIELSTAAALDVQQNAGEVLVGIQK